MRDEGLRARLLERCDLGPEATLLLGAGRHGPEKRWPMVIDAVRLAGTKAPVGLVIAGDGRERARVARAAANNPHVHLVSPVSDRQEVARLFASCDALVHGCEAEVFCTVGGEARAAGLPLIMPNRGGAADHAKLGESFVYTSADPRDAALAILDFIAVKDRARAAPSSSRRACAPSTSISPIFSLIMKGWSPVRSWTGASGGRVERRYFEKPSLSRLKYCIVTVTA